MIIYRVTAVVPATIVQEWLSWMLEVHIPEVLATGCFFGNAIHRCLDENVIETTFVINYHASSMEHYQRYASQHAPTLQSKHTNKYGALVAASRMLLTDCLSD